MNSILFLVALTCGTVESKIWRQNGNLDDDLLTY